MRWKSIQRRSCDYRQVGKYSAYVRPRNFPVGSSCTRITGISDETVAGAKELPEALEDFLRWIVDTGRLLPDPAEEVLQRLRQLLGPGHRLVAPSAPPCSGGTRRTGTTHLRGGDRRLCSTSFWTLR